MLDRETFLRIIASTVFMCWTPGIFAGNLRMISSREGISNNSILCLNQDTDGYIWLGTCEGLNLWDGRSMVCYPQEGSGMKPLSGNLIEKIQPTRDRYYWLRTNYGLDLMHRTKVIEQHKEFQGSYFLISRNKSETIVLTQDGSFYGYCEEAASFQKIPDAFQIGLILPPGPEKAIPSLFSGRTESTERPLLSGNTANRAISKKSTGCCRWNSAMLLRTRIG